MDEAAQVRAGVSATSSAPLDSLAALFRGQRVAVVKTGDSREALGVNTVEQLKEADEIFAELAREGRI